jgi:hypothetical protein
MSSRVFFYCLKVWLASVLIGPMLFSGVQPLLDEDAAYTLNFFLGFWGYMILYGLGFSLVSFLLFWGGMIYITHQEWSSNQRRMAAAFLGIALTVAPFMVLFGTVNILMPKERIIFCLCYLLPILAGIFWYRFPGGPKPGMKLQRQ